MASGGLMDNLAAKNSPNSSSENEEVSSSLQFLWLYAVLIQVLFAFEVIGVWAYFGLSLNLFSLISIQIFMYLILSVWAFFSFKEHGILSLHDIKKLIYFLLISAIYVAVPFYSYLIPNGSFLGGPSLSEWFSLLFYVVFPLWPIYIANKTGQSNIAKWTHKYVNIWIIFLIFVFIFFFASNIRASDLVQAGGRPELTQATNVIDYLAEKVVQTGKNFWKSINLQQGVLNVLNASGINYYTGMVDQNEKAPVGLYITNVRAVDKYFYEGSPVTIWADIRGKSFTEEIHVNPHCYIDTTGSKKGVDGVTRPSEFSILGEKTQYLECTFDSLPKGSHTVKIDASFNFQTWAYVTYTFVDMQLARSMEVQGKNVNSELDIDRIPQAIYTNGPVMLGMGTMIDQPIEVDPENNREEAIIGVTLSDQWSEGHLDRVDQFILQVPDDFDLVSCDRWYPVTKKEPYETKDGYNFFKFTREELTDPRTQFKSVTCRIKIKDPKKFMSGQQKVQRTFATQADYTYVLQKITSVSVRQ